MPGAFQRDVDGVADSLRRRRRRKSRTRVAATPLTVKVLLQTHCDSRTRRCAEQAMVGGDVRGEQRALGDERLGRQGRLTIFLAIFASICTLFPTARKSFPAGPRRFHFPSQVPSHTHSSISQGGSFFWGYNAGPRAPGSPWARRGAPEQVFFAALFGIVWECRLPQKPHNRAGS